MSSPKPHDVEFLLSQTSWVPAITRQLVRDAHLADDVVQATWAAALEHAPATDNPHKLRAWLYVVARNFACRMQKRDVKRRHSEEEAAKPEALAEPDDELDRVHRHKLLAEAVLALAEPYRTAITLRYFSELDYEAIAARQNITTGAARQRVSRGLALLRERLDRQFDGDRRAWCIMLGALPRPTTAPQTTAGPSGLSLPWRTALLATAAGALAVAVWFASNTSTADEIAQRIAGSEPANSAAELSALSVSGDSARRLAAEAGAGTVVQVTSAPETAPADNLHGIVLDAAGRPLAGARVVIRRNDARAYPIPERNDAQQLVDVAHGLSGSDGAFSFALPAGLPHDVFVTHESGLLAIVSNRYAGENVLVRATPPATLRGRVHRADGSGVAGAVLRGWTSNDAMVALFEGATSADGSFQFENLPEIGIGLQVLPQGETHDPWLVASLVGGRTTTLDVQVTSGVTVRGCVRDEETGLPIAGATVGLHDRYMPATTTALDGSFELCGIPPGNWHEVHVRADGYGESTRLPTIFAPGKAPLDFKLARERVVTGRVLAPDGAAVAGAYVAVVGVLRTADGATKIDSRSTSTGTDGRFTASGLRRGIRHSLFVRSPGYGSVAYEIPLRDVDERTVAVPDVVLAPPVVLEGQVVDEFGRPMVDCAVTLRGVNADYERFAPAPDGPGGANHVDRRRGRTDDRGRFAFADLAFGTYGVAAALAGVTSEVTVTIAERPARALPRITLRTGLGIEGRVTDGAGQPVMGASIYVRESGGSYRFARSAIDGSFRVLGLGSGPYTVEIEPERRNGPDETRELCFGRITDVHGGDAPLAVTLVRGVPITGRMFDQKGEPAAFTHLEARAPDGRRVDRVFTAEDGSFVFAVDSLAQVDLVAEGRRKNSIPTICAKAVTAGASDLVLELPE